MSYVVPTCEPTQIEAGSVAYWDKTLPDFPASDGWQLVYYLRGAVDVTLVWDTEVTANGDVFEVRIPAATTDNLTTAGAYRLIGRVSLDGEVHTVYNAPLLVLADPATAVGAKSHNRTMRDSLRTALQSAAANSTMVSITVNGRTVQWARGEADAQLAHYEYLVAVEENPHGSISHETAFVRG